MLVLQTGTSNPFSPLSLKNPNPSFFNRFFSSTQSPNPNQTPKPLPLFAISASSKPTPNPNSVPKPTPRRQNPENTDDDLIIPRKPRRGRRSEAAAVEDFVRNSLKKTFDSIRSQNSTALDGKEEILKKKLGEEEEEERGEVVEEDDPDWPVDAEIGWGIRASDYFEKHRIENVVEDGVEIDWEGEVDEGWVKEINCLEWESFAFHPSPLIVLVFERYNRAADNWKLLKELEKATKVYWSAKDRLPPRTVKIDMNIEKDLAYALKVKECPQLLFLRGNRILYRESVIRTADELVHMIAYFYYNAKKPSWIDEAAVAPY
eukprot:TRINITY_DN21592_c0_g1_i1.p1 TRINITY_DN21592_c0_g1~~TRINITY_DN21592_c0_g1_i1.p1  ORF type:complete len:318 (-),score=70.05 TRINITY_DN21592_c0_g1_i1:378-1331(-)